MQLGVVTRSHDQVIALKSTVNLRTPSMSMSGPAGSCVSAVGISATVPSFVNA